MGWKENFKRELDFKYSRVKKKFPDIRFPCYGAKFYRFLASSHIEYICLYLTQNSLVYTGVYHERMAERPHKDIEEIPFKDIKKLSIKRGRLIKSRFSMRFTSGRKYHFYIYDIKDFSTDMTGNGSDNVKNFISTLRSSVDKVQA